MCDIHRSVFLGFHHVQLSMNINTVAACRTVVGSLGPQSPCLFYYLSIDLRCQRLPKCVCPSVVTRKLLAQVVLNLYTLFLSIFFQLFRPPFRQLTSTLSSTL